MRESNSINVVPQNTIVVLLEERQLLEPQQPRVFSL